MAKLAGHVGHPYPMETTKLGKGKGNFGRGGAQGRFPDRWKQLNTNNNNGTLKPIDPSKPK
jgi:hypothetical protein